MSDVRWRRVASHVADPRRAVGGRLSVEDDELVFRPHAVDRLLLASEWRLPLAEIEAVDTVGPDLRQVRSGGLRSRLAVRTAAGETVLFVVWRPRAKAAELAALARV